MSSTPQTDVGLCRALREWWAENMDRRGFAPTCGRFVAESWGFLRDSTFEQRRRRYGDVEYDWEHRVDTTSATVGWRSRLVGVFRSPYQPTDPALFHEMLQRLPIDFSGFTFVDLGSGKGRTLLMASEYPFRRILGVELLPELHRIACVNVAKYANETQKCFALETVCGDAREFCFPAEPTVLYLFNPLPEAGLRVAIRNLEESLRQSPRRVFVLYHNPLLELVLLSSPALVKTGGTHQYSVFASR